MRTDLLLTIALALPLLGANAGTPPMTVSVVLNFEKHDYDRAALQSMQAEAEAILQNLGVRVNWTIHGEVAAGREFGDLLVFRMKGKCAMDSFPVVPDELGLPLASTLISDGEMLSFGEVDCDRVRHSLKRTVSGSDYGKGQQLLGRALGRVVAHEMYHMLSGSTLHAEEGVTKRCLTSRELAAERLALSEKSLAAIRDQIALVRKQSVGMASPGGFEPPLPP